MNRVLLNQLQGLAWFNNQSLFLYGDHGQPVHLHLHLQAPYRQRNVTRDQVNHDKAMSEVRAAVEWFFHELKTYIFFILSYS